MSGLEDRVTREEWAAMSSEAVNAAFAARGHDVRVVDDGPRCPDLRMYAYDNGPADFGYRDWRCDLREGHAGDHKSWDWSR